MSVDPASPASQVISQAFQALKSGRRSEARALAFQAAGLDPGLEDAWLVLAALAPPDASIAYLNRALEINPGSMRALRGMRWARARLQKTQLETNPFQEDTQKIILHSPAGSAALAVSKPAVPPPAARPRPAPASEKGGWFELAFLSLTAIGLMIVLTGLIWLVFSSGNAVKALSSSSYRPPEVLIKPSLTPPADSAFTSLKMSSPSSVPGSNTMPTSSPSAEIISTTIPTTFPSSTMVPTGTASPLPTETQTPTVEIPTETPVPEPELPTEVPYVEAIPVEEPVVVEYPVEEAPLYDDQRWIDVNLSEQHVYAYEGGQVVGDFIASTGTWDHPTVTGQYYIYVKYRYTDMSGPGYYLANVPYTMYFYKGYGLHGTYWHNNFGVPMSHGCVNLRTADAGWLYNWASVGTLVNVHY